MNHPDSTYGSQQTQAGTYGTIQSTPMTGYDPQSQSSAYGTVQLSGDPTSGGVYASNPGTGGYPMSSDQQSSMTSSYAQQPLVTTTAPSYMGSASNPINITSNKSYWDWNGTAGSNVINSNFPATAGNGGLRNSDMTSYNASKQQQQPHLKSDGVGFAGFSEFGDPMMQHRGFNVSIIYVLGKLIV